MKNSKLVSIILVVVWTIVIFLFSNTNSIKSNFQSKGSIQKVINVVEKVDKVKMDNTKKETLITLLNKPLRKVAHFSIYLILSLLMINFLSINKVRDKYKKAQIFCTLYAITDEFHQLFISGRSGQISDVIIDSCGALVGIIVYKYVKKCKEVKKNK